MKVRMFKTLARLEVWMFKTLARLEVLKFGCSRRWRVLMVKTRGVFGLLCAGALGAVMTWVATAHADGVPAALGSPALTYSGVLLRDGVPVTTPVEVEVGLWTDQARGAPDEVLCSTGEGTIVTPDAFGTFSIDLPDAVGEGQDGKSCLDALAAAFPGTRPTVFVQVEIAREFISYTVDGDPGTPGTQATSVDRLPISAVPFAIEADRSSSASGALAEQLARIETRLSALEQ